MPKQDMIEAVRIIVIRDDPCYDEAYQYDDDVIMEMAEYFRRIGYLAEDVLTYEGAYDIYDVLAVLKR